MSMDTRFGASRLDSSNFAPLSGQLPQRLKPLETVDVLAAIPDEKPLIFDACHVGVILRAVLFVELVLAVGLMFHTASFMGWMMQLALITGAALPAVLAWLVVACALKKRLQNLPSWQQWSFGIGLGALCGLYGCGLMVYIGFAPSNPWVASACAGALFAAALVGALVWRAAARMPALASARLTELQSRIRPHFLFNTLNSAVALVREDPAKAETVLEDLSELFRSALVVQSDAVSLSDEIELARRYLDIEQVRFGNRLRVQWSLDARAADAKVPPLFMQPLVENAVKHGVEPSTKGADIKVSTEVRGGSSGTVVIKITNTVPGGPGQAGHGVALRNVAERLKLLHDVQASFHTNWQGGIYQVRIEVPVST
jgi:two-component system, LytTR family, sensor histidine kinase AlgZ